jgi:TolB protein
MILTQLSARTENSWLSRHAETGTGICILEIFIRSASDPGQAPLPLTQNPAADYSPAWSPLGRQIAFISNRTGEPEVWVADLDHAGNPVNISKSALTINMHPAWSPDGSKLAWAAIDPDSGITSLYFWDARNPDFPAQWVGSGDWPVWQDNDHLASQLKAPNQNYLAAYTTTGSISLPPMLLPGAMNGLSYGVTNVALPGPFQAAAQVTPPFPSNSDLDRRPNISSGRASLVTLANVTAAYPQLNENAIDAFQALRSQVAALSGWDALGNLENAFVPLTTPLDPGFLPGERSH